MQNLQTTFAVSDFSSGMIDENSVSKSLMPKNAVRKAVNVVFDRPRGGISQRYGTTKVGDSVSAGQTGLGLHNFRSTTGSAHRLFAVFNGTIFGYDGSNWTSTATGIGSSKARFITYLDKCVYMNGTTVRSWNGSSWLATSDTTVDIDNWPASKFATVLNSRVLVGGLSDPDTVKLSSLVSSSAISWTSGNKSVVVSPNDGAGGITGVTGNGRISLIFKERGLYRYDDTELQRIGYVGTPSYESIITDDLGVTYFFGQGANGVGFYATNGGRPVKISRPIDRWVEAIAGSYYGSVAGYANGRFIEWSVGSVTVDGITYANASVVYFVSDKTWAIFNRADSFRVFSQYIDSNSNITVVGADTDGDVQTINSGNTDNSTNITSECELYGLSLTTRGRQKSVSELVAIAEHFQGLSVLAQMDDGDYQMVGSVDERHKFFSNLPQLRGHELFLKITATNAGVPFQFAGFEIPAGAVTDENYG